MKRIINLTIVLFTTLVMVFAGAGTVFAADSSTNATQNTQAAVPVTNPAPGIKIDLHHILLQSDSGNNVQLTEVIKFDNTSKKVFTGNTASGGTKGVLKFSLPGGYTNLQVDGINKDSLITTSDGLVTTSPLDPGTTQVTLSYNIPFINGSITFTKIVNYPTDTLYVLSPKGQLQINGDAGIQDYGIQNVDNTQYHVFSMNQPIPGQNFSLSIAPDRVGQGYQDPTGFHSASHIEWWNSTPLRNTNPHYWVAGIIILFFGLIAAFGRYLRIKQLKQKTKEEQEHLDGLLDNLVIRQKRLLDKIASLDQKYNSYEVNSEDYNALREQYVSKLVKIKMKIKELETLEYTAG